MGKGFTAGVAAIAGILVAAAACSGAPDSPAVTGPTFHADVEPILQARCQSCHVEGGLAPFPLVTYEQVSGEAELVALKTASRQMPPWDALETPDCKPVLPFRADERLTDAQIATIQAWK